jgi:chromatin remodeling complex protein RSC6
VYKMPRAKNDAKTSAAKAKTTKATKKEAKPAAAKPAKEVKAEVTENVVTEQVDTMSSDFTKLLGRIQQVSSTLTAIKNELRTLEKRANRELKEAKKASGKSRRASSGNRQPSGFVKPTRISAELATFLGKPKDTEMARTEVTKEINAYIRAHGLQDKSNGRIIRPDSKLTSLLKLKKDDELTYFNLQRYMSPHFAKASSTSA